MQVETNENKPTKSSFSAVLKDVPNSPFDLLKNPEMDAVRMGLFPSLDYKGLYNSIIPLIEVAPLIPYGLKGKYATNILLLFEKINAKYPQI